MMTCAEARAQLAELVYGELDANLVATLHKHLAGCVACQQERDSLAGVRRLLDRVPAPPHVQVDVLALYAEANRRRGVRIRRWRRLAGVAGLAAAALLLLCLKLEVRLEGHQLVLRWGAPPETTPRSLPAPVPPPVAAPPEVTAADLALVKELIHALAASGESRDQECQQALAQLRERFDDLQGQAQARWEATQRYVSALTTVQLDSHDKGEKQ
jgi:hypothetical protein